MKATQRERQMQVNRLTDRFANAIYQYNRQENGRDFVPMNVKGERVLLEIIGGADGVRALVDAYCLDALKEMYPHWQSVAVALLICCLDGEGLSTHGVGIWQSMVNDMGASAADYRGEHDAQY